MKMLPRILVAVTVVLISANSVWADALKIGVVAPLTGLAGGMGSAYTNGITLFREEHPEAKNLLQFITEDSKYDSKTVSLSLNKLIEIDKVKLAAVWGNSPAETAMPILTQKVSLEF